MNYILFSRDIIREVVGFLTFMCIMYVITVGSRNPHSFRLQYQLQNSFVNQPFCHEELFQNFEECDRFCNTCKVRRTTIGKTNDFKWKDSTRNIRGKWKTFKNLTTTDDFWDWAHSIILPGTVLITVNNSFCVFYKILL